MRHKTLFFDQHTGPTSTIVKESPRKKYIKMRQYIEHEIRNIRMLRNINLCLVLLLHLLLIALYTWVSYSIYREHGLATNFIMYALPTVAYVPAISLLVFAPIFWLVYNRFRIILLDIKDLNEEFAQLYTEYAQQRPRFFPTPPQYLISQKGLLVFKNFRRITFAPHSIQKIVVRRINQGLLRRKCVVRIYQDEKLITSFRYPSHYPEEVDFLKQHVTLINRSIVLEDEM